MMNEFKATMISEKEKPEQTDQEKEDLTIPDALGPKESDETKNYEKKNNTRQQHVQNNEEIKNNKLHADNDAILTAEINIEKLKNEIHSEIYNYITKKKKPK